MFEILNNYGIYYWKGIMYTLALSGLSLIIGTLLGLFLSLMRLSKNKFANLFSKVYISIFRGTPLFVQLTLVHFGLYQVSSLTLSPFVSGLIAVSLNSAAYVAEIIRSGIQSLDKGQMEAGRSLGLSEATTMRHIILPQAVQNILPALGNEFITLVKETSIVSQIGVMDLMWGAEKVNAATYKYGSLVWAAIFYFIITFTLSKILERFEKKVAVND